MRQINRQDSNISFRIDPETRNRLKEISILTDRSASGMIRWLINKFWEQRYTITEAGQRALTEYRDNGNETQE